MRTTSWTLIALTSAACSGPDATGETATKIVGLPDTTPDDSGIDPEETAPEGGTFIDAASFVVIGGFAFDPDLQQHVEFAFPGEGLSPMYLSVLLVDSSAYTEGLTTANSCQVTIEISGPRPVAPWVEQNGAWTGFDVPLGSKTIDGCLNYGLPGEFGGDAAGQVSKWAWGFGVAPLADEVRDALEVGLPASEWAALQPYAVGSAAVTDLPVSDANSAGYFSLGYAVANEVDGNMQVEVTGIGNPIPIDAALVEQETGVTRGYYEVVLGSFAPGSVLTTDPPPPF